MWRLPEDIENTKKGILDDFSLLKLFGYLQEFLEYFKKEENGPQISFSIILLIFKYFLPGYNI